ncbi:MAG TPA: oxidoreductase, partial [Candidatus Hydrogenedentes bacterium]|nr:oxidoreductase [Candidatus Hydrogenedentota bacterium]
MKKYSSRVVVVGTGAGGAVAGALLAQAGMDVTLLEQGRNYKPEDFKDVITSFAKMYVNGGATIALGNPPIPIPLGKAVGGSTLVNSSTCFRPPRNKVEKWDCVDWELFEKSLAAVEERIHAVPVDESLLGGNYTVLKRGCDALGVAIKP